MTKDKDNKVKGKSPSSLRRTSKTSTRSTRRKEKPGVSASPSSRRKSQRSKRRTPKKDMKEQTEKTEKTTDAEDAGKPKKGRFLAECQDLKKSSFQSGPKSKSLKGGRPPRLRPSTSPVPSALPDRSDLVTSPVVPQALLIDGPAGVPIVVPLDVHDGDGEVVKAVPTLSDGPVAPTPGCLSLHWSGLLHFAPSCTLEQDKGKAVFASNTTPGSLTKILGGIAAFIADYGARLPDTPNTKDPKDVKKKIGETVPVSGFIKIDSKSMCHFTRIDPTASLLFCPKDASMGVLVRDKTTGCLFFVPTEGRTVGPMLRAGAKENARKPPQGCVLGLVVRENSGLLAFRAPSEGRDGLVGYVMGSPTGVPIFVNKPASDDSTRTAMLPDKKGREEKLPTEEEMKTLAEQHTAPYDDVYYTKVLFQAAEAGKKAEAELKEADDKAAAERAAEKAKREEEKIEYQKHLNDRSKHYNMY